MPGFQQHQEFQAFRGFQKILEDQEVQECNSLEEIVESEGSMSTWTLCLQRSSGDLIPIGLHPMLSSSEGVSGSSVVGQLSIFSLD